VLAEEKENPPLLSLGVEEEEAEESLAPPKEKSEVDPPEEVPVAPEPKENPPAEVVDSSFLFSGLFFSSPLAPPNENPPDEGAGELPKVKPLEGVVAVVEEEVDDPPKENPPEAGLFLPSSSLSFGALAVAPNEKPENPEVDVVLSSFFSV